MRTCGVKTPHEPRQPAGWQIWGTCEEEIWICCRSNMASLEERERRIGEMSEEEFNMRPANMACHNLLRDGIQLPNGTKTLLGLGLNYCIKSSLRSKITTKHTFTRLREDARRMYALRDAQDQGDYIQSLYSLKDIRLNIPTFSPPPPLSLSLSIHKSVATKIRA